jgi:hypothetical protein
LQSNAAAKDDSSRASALEEPVGAHSEQRSIESVTNSPEIEKLFAKWPNLRTQLRSIYEASLQHHHTGENSKYHREENLSHVHGEGYDRGHDHMHGQRRNTGTGIENGLKKLRYYLEASHPDSIGLDEFCNNVTKAWTGNAQKHLPQ